MKSKQFFLLLYMFSFYDNLIVSQDLNMLVDKCWATNKEIQQKEFDIRAAEFSLKEARAQYLPNISFGTTYSLAYGGRSIDFPIGDLLNPAHDALNMLTNSMQFPQLENTEVQLLPNNYYDAKFRISQPIYYPEIAINKHVKLKQQELKALELRAFKRLLSKDVMLAYFNCQSALQAIDILKEASLYLAEAKRVTQSMVKNGVALPSSNYRIDAEIASLDANMIDAQTMLLNAKQYLFYLTGETDMNAAIPSINLSELPQIKDITGTNREEIDQLQKAVEMHNLSVSLERSFYKPKVGLQLDLGSQDFDFKFNPYALLGVNIEINVFDGKKHQYRLEQSKMQVAASESKLQSVQDQIALQHRISQQSFQGALQKANTYQTRIQTSEIVSAEVLKKYKEGSSNYLELVDANTKVVQTQLQYNLARFEAWKYWAEHLYNTASYPIQ